VARRCKRRGSVEVPPLWMWVVMYFVVVSMFTGESLF
jgi:hypothetical protein